MPENLTLYQYDSCPFCARVRRFMTDARIVLPMKDILRDPAARRELLQGGGSSQVPCLRIEQGGQVRWLYESLDIIDFLRERAAGLAVG